ncbi:MAG: serine--tRNA ligase [Flavobacteriales bacterium]|nr:serine--tRNA ligase [Flavobacteriales bacterium]
MLQTNFIRENKEKVLEGLAKRNFKDAPAMIDKVLTLDDARRAAQNELDNNLSSQNALAKEIGDMFKTGRATQANALKEKTAELKAQSKDLGDKLAGVEKELQDLLYLIPNVPYKDVVQGFGAEDNQVVFEKGVIEDMGKDALPHWELAEKYDIIDFKLGVKITGAGFPVYKGKGARLQRALVNFFLDRNTAAGYTEIEPPHMVNEASGYGTGQLPDKEGQMYFNQVDNLYMIPTAEVPVTNIFRDVVLDASQLPVCCTAYTPCFRREAGSYGKDVRGLNRLHQFDKVEIVRVERPENSYKALEGMLEHVKGLLEDLELPYHILRLCGGDMGFTSAMTFDFEVFSEAQKRWLEVSSVSNFETFQSNRLHLRIKDENGNRVLAHTLNGSSLALPRIVAALLENHQTPKGIRIPKALVPYTGFEYID